MIDFLTLMLINMAAGLVVLARYVCEGVGRPRPAEMGSGVALPGLVALLNGLRVAWTWPLPEGSTRRLARPSVLLGVLFIGAAWSMATNT